MKEKRNTAELKMMNMKKQLHIGKYYNLIIIFLELLTEKQLICYQPKLRKRPMLLKNT